MKRTLLILVVSAAIATPAIARDSIDSPTSAAGVVKAYYAAIARHDYHAAYLCWDDNGQAAGKNEMVFRRGFARTVSVRAAVGKPFDGEGAAGSTYIQVPVEIWSQLAGGKRQHFRGIYTLRRVNNVDGATPAQLRWHLYSAKISSAR